MESVKKYYTKNFVLLLVIALFLLISCAKEYSFEGLQPAPIDTLQPQIITNIFPSCSLCIASSGTDLSSWSFSIGNSSLCGEIDTAIVSPQRTAFTFFGPSACSNDTGMVISVYLLTDTLNRDIRNLTLYYNAFYFYERVTPSDIYVSRQNNPFIVKIESYDHLNKIATGTFEGNVFSSNSSGARITNGKFKVKLL